MTALVHELIVKNWIELLFAIATALMTWGYRTLANKLKEEEKKNDCIATGVQCLLRQNIIDAYYKYTDMGYCPVTVKEALSMMYDAYSGLGGNDVATNLYHRILELPSEKVVEGAT